MGLGWTADQTMRKGTVALQAQVRGHQARLKVLALRYLNACLMAQRIVRGFVKRNQVLPVVVVVAVL